MKKILKILLDNLIIMLCILCLCIITTKKTSEKYKHLTITTQLYKEEVEQQFREELTPCVIAWIAALGCFTKIVVEITRKVDEEKK